MGAFFVIFTLLRSLHNSSRIRRPRGTESASAFDMVADPRRVACLGLRDAPERESQAYFAEYLLNLSRVCSRPYLGPLVGPLIAFIP